MHTQSVASSFVNNFSIQFKVRTAIKAVSFELYEKVPLKHSTCQSAKKNLRIAVKI